jgi:spore coat protein H
MKKVLLFIITILFSCRGHESRSIHTANPKSDSPLKEIYIYCDKKQFDNIYENWEQNIYIPVTIYTNGIENNKARMRIRGDTSREFAKKSLKIKLDAEPFIFGYKILNLNADYEDPSFIHQYLASYVFQQSGTPCFNAEHVRIFLNDKYFGLYLMVENMDEDFLLTRNLDEHANMYKATKDGACLGYYDDVDFHWEKKTNEYSGREDLRELINILDTIPDSKYYDYIKNNFDYEKLINIMSVNILITNSSTYYHNYYMYHDVNKTGKWMMFPWDLDKTFSRYGNIYYNHSSSFWQHDNPLLERTVSNKKMLSDIKLRVNDLGKTLFNPEILDPKIDSLQALLRPSLEQDETDNITSIAEWEAQLQKEKEFIKDRVNQINYHIDNIPYNFRIIRTPEVITDDYVFRWFSSDHPKDKDLSYSFIYSKDLNLSEGKNRMVIENLRDTFLVCPDNLDNGRYYWKVVVTDGINPVDGWDNLNYFEYRKGTELPINIAQELVLTEEGSPYFIREETSVAKSGSLIVHKGAEIRFSRGVNLFVYGKISAYGTKEEPIIFKPNDGEEYWGYIYIINPWDRCEFIHTKFKEGNIYAKQLDLKIENTQFTIEKKNLAVNDQRQGVIWLWEGSFEMRNSIIKSNGTGEGMNINKATALVENCLIDGAPDAIEYIEVHDGIIRANEVINSPDDAVDFNGCKRVIIENNIFRNNADKGISVGHEGNGPSTEITIKKNLIINCRIGISVKDSSEALILNNTLVDNQTGIQCYHKDHSVKGGKARVINCIFANSQNTFSIDELSSIEFSYSLSTNEKLKGEGNLKNDPGFFNPDKGDFHLKPGSPALTIHHPDFNELYIGALPQKQFNVRINEISFGSENKGGEWIEIFNHGNIDLDIGGWKLEDKRRKNAYIFKENTIIESNECIVVVNSLDHFKKEFPEEITPEGNLPFRISSKAEDLYLLNSYSEIIDHVNYHFTSEKGFRKNKYYTRMSDNQWKLKNKPSPGVENPGWLGNKLIILFSLMLLCGILLGWSFWKRSKK